jgi:antitoxin (DNA-binding transcriptional repressor) of toxin-antitoxin stability system
LTNRARFFMLSRVKIVNVHEAKTHLSALLAEVAAGKEIVIAKAGRPVARLSQFRRAADRKERELGIDEGRGWIAPDFDDPLPGEILEAFSS